MFALIFLWGHFNPFTTRVKKLNSEKSDSPGPKLRAHLWDYLRGGGGGGRECKQT